MKGLFGSLFGKGQKSPPDQQGGKAVRRIEPHRDGVALYKKGDVIGSRYEVHGTLGKGGFGIVYLVYCRDTCKALALKTFRDELLADPAAREAFKKEALLWVNLETHPFILAAECVDEVSGRLFVLMEYIAPDVQGRVSLAEHLARAGGPLDTNQTLKWAIQFCLGMEHAGAQGVQCHRDIKPDNILITQDGTLKISDFGLAAAAEVAWRGSRGRGGSLVTGGAEGGFGFSLIQAEGKMRCGTPGYIAPEVYRGEWADIRSDIYSFGLVLWQMATGSRVPPFMVPWRGDMESYLRGIYEQQMAARVPRVKGRLGSVIERCLRPSPSERYGSLQELRVALEPIWEGRTGRKFELPQIGERTGVFWISKGSALATLDRHEEAIRCFNEALVIDPRDVTALSNKGTALVELGRNEEAIACFDKALAIDPGHAHAWRSKGCAFHALGRHEEAIGCYDKALAIDPRRAYAWSNKAKALDTLGRREEAIGCYDKALAIDPRCADALINKGLPLAALGRHEEAIGCYDKALAIDPRSAYAWSNKATDLEALGRHEEAIGCYDKALAIDPRHAYAWCGKGETLRALGRHEEAIGCFDRTLAIDPRYACACKFKIMALHTLGRHEEMIRCLNKFSEFVTP